MNLSKEITAQGKKHFCKLYGISLNTFNKWIKEEPIRTELEKAGYKPPSRTFKPNQVKIIYKTYDYPDQITVDDRNQPF